MLALPIYAMFYSVSEVLVPDTTNKQNKAIALKQM